MDTAERFHASYTQRDVILYALALGYGPDDLPFCYEDDPSFTVLPMFVVTLLFWAKPRNQPKLKTMPPFPPPLMKALYNIPPSLFKDERIKLDTLPILHTWQSITFHSNLPVPKRHEIIDTELETRIKYINPKAMGTFIDSETSVTVANRCICTLQSTLLLVGLLPEHLHPTEIRKPENVLPRRPKDTQPTITVQLSVSTAQALWYRVASGDSNAIHVTASAVFDQPILHGLCTLGMALRTLPRAEQVQHVQAQFAQPVFLNDTLTIQWWQLSKREYALEVYNQNGDCVIRKGYIRIQAGPADSKL